MAKHYQRTDTMLQEWMDTHSETDGTLADKLNISRAHVSRLRRGKYGASKETALKLEAETGIAWHTFIEPSVEAAQ